MQTIINHDKEVTFQLGPAGTPYRAVVMDVHVEKRVIGDKATTLIYYDLDVFYNPEFGLRTRIDRVHSSFIKQ